MSIHVYDNIHMHGDCSVNMTTDTACCALGIQLCLYDLVHCGTCTVVSCGHQSC